MRGRGRSRRGLSEIVGTLMLVLIVVVAATAFAAFVESYQKQLQAQQAVAQQRSLESLRIVSVATTPNATSPGTLLATVNVSAASESINPSRITEVELDGNPLRNFTLLTLNQSTGTFGVAQYVKNSAPVNVSSREQFIVSANVSGGRSTTSFYFPSIVLNASAFVKVEILTFLENDFTRTFVPPTAVGIVGAIDVFGPSGPITIPELDGSGSIQTGNDTIVAWNWFVLNLTTPSRSYNVTGEKVVAPFALGGVPPGGLSYRITLTVLNSAGLVGKTTFPERY